MVGSSVASSYIGDAQGGLDGAKEGQILLLPTPPVKKSKHQSPQDAIDEFWAKFNSKTPGKASTILPKNVHAKKVGQDVPKGVIEGENAVASYEEAVKICKDKVAKIVKECRRVNQKYRDPHFDIEFDLKWGVRDCLTMLSGTPEDDDITFRPGSVKRVGDIFDAPKFYVKGATANDIRQGRDGDCWFMAALCTLGNKDGLIEKVCVARDEQIGVYGFVFHRDGEWRSEVIDDKLYLTKPDYDESWIERNLIEDRQRINSEEDYRKIYQSNSGALYFAQCEDPDETWLPLLEKAYAKAHGDYSAIEGGFTGEGLEDLTGGVTTELFSTDILDKEYFWKEELLKVNQDFLFGCASGIFWGRGYRKGIYEGHAYSIMRAVEIDGQRLCLLRNPWGQGEWTGAWSDGSKEWTPEWMQKLDHRFGDDGAFWMSYDDLLKKYQTFDRTRLFSDDWKVTQQWTSLTVPWTVDYHNTKFSFTLERKASVVIVLSQLDERYFRGLEGEYRFELSFRIHKAGEDDYIIRSHGNYWMRRSVTAELELEEGEYHVLMRVEAVKDKGTFPVEDVLRKNAKDRRDKLLRIGLAYDLAHAKGQLKETDEEKKAKKAKEKAKADKEKKELKDKLVKEKKRQKHVLNKEIAKQRVAKAKRVAKQKAKAAKKAEKEKEAKDKKEKEDAEKDKADKEAKAKENVKEVKEAESKDDDSKDKGSSEKTESKDDGKAAQPAVISNDKTETAAAAGGDSMAPDQTPTSEEKKTSDEAEKSLAPEQEPLAEEKKVSDETEKTSASSSLKPVAPQPAPSGLSSRILLIGSATPSIIGGFDSDSDSDSDLDSNVSDITSGEIEVQLKQIKEEEKSKAEFPVPDEEEEDEFQKDPWNAIVVVGLRVYSKGSCISVKVVRPPEVDDDDTADGDAGSDAAKQDGEGKLDVDDSARDATKGEDKKVDEQKCDEKKADEGEKEDAEVNVMEEKTSDGEVVESDDKKSAESAKTEDGSEGSVVIV